ncbi:TIGR00725 family protein [Flavobacterium sp.]|uniref:TIGR00725 family protein n=1 Tax=Flavobacterium sp. TaxID=239 RepID=UPI00404856D3
MQVGVIGSNSSQCNDELYDFAYMLGQHLGHRGYTVINGGMHGVMEAISKGVKNSQNPKSVVVGILPSANKQEANEYLDVIIPTDLGLARNYQVVLASDVLIALGGGAGTLNEISYAWQCNKKVFCYMATDGWSSKLANTNLDSRRENLLIGFKTLEELLTLLDNNG